MWTIEAWGLNHWRPLYATTWIMVNTPGKHNLSSRRINVLKGNVMTKTSKTVFAAWPLSSLFMTNIFAIITPSWRLLNSCLELTKVFRGRVLQTQVTLQFEVRSLVRPIRPHQTCFVQWCTVMWKQEGAIPKLNFAVGTMQSDTVSDFTWPTTL